MQVVETTFPMESVTVKVYVVVDVSTGVGYKPPLTAAPVMSELPTPWEPITAVFAPENVGNRFTEELYGGVVKLGTRLLATGGGRRTVRVAGPPVAEPAEFETATVNAAPLSPATVGGVV
jgi:hypothetical protein